MSGSSTAALLHPESVEAIYVEHRELLLYVAARKFRVPESEAEPLVQEAIMALLTTRHVITHPRSWLIAAVCNGSRAYWRARARIDGSDVVPESIPAVIDSAQLDRQILIGQLLARLPSRLREVLRMHYLQQFTAREVAERLGLTHGYVEKLIHQGLQTLRSAMRGRWNL